MLKKLLIIKFLLLFFSISYAEDFKIVYLNIDKIMEESIAGKSIKKKLENLYNKDLEKFKKNDEILKQKEKKIIAQKNIMSQDDFQNEITNLRSEIIKLLVILYKTIKETNNKSYMRNSVLIFI